MRSRSVPATPHDAIRAGRSAWAAYRRARPGPVDLAGLQLRHVVVNESTLHRPNSAFQRFRTLDLAGIDLRDVDLRGSYLREVDLARGSLERADLRGAVLRWVNLSGADLSGADLRDADLVGCSFVGARLRGARLGGTYLGASSLRTAGGLNNVEVDGRCVADPFTIVTSVIAGDVWPRPFAAAFSLPEGLHDLALGVVPPALPRCFVSYRSRDERLVEDLHGRLVERHVPAWYAPEHLRQRLLRVRGTDPEPYEAETMRGLFEFVDESEVVIVIVTPASIAPDSKWVRREVSRVRAGRPVWALQAADVEEVPGWLTGRVSRWFDARGRSAGSDLDMLAAQLVDALQDVGDS